MGEGEGRKGQDGSWVSPCACPLLRDTCPSPGRWNFGGRALVVRRPSRALIASPTSEPTSWAQPPLQLTPCHSQSHKARSLEEAHGCTGQRAFNTGWNRALQGWGQRAVLSRICLQDKDSQHGQLSHLATAWARPRATEAPTDQHFFTPRAPAPGARGWVCQDTVAAGHVSCLAAQWALPGSPGGPPPSPPGQLGPPPPTKPPTQPHISETREWPFVHKRELPRRGRASQTSSLMLFFHRFSALMFSLHSRAKCLSEPGSCASCQAVSSLASVILS